MRTDEEFNEWIESLPELDSTTGNEYFDQMQELIKNQ